MSLRCKVCNDMIRIKEQKFGFVDSKYCSLRCRFISMRFPMLIAGLVTLGAYLGISLPLFYSDDDLWFLFVVMFPIIFLGLIFIGVSIGGFISKVRKNQELARRQTYCMFCGDNITDITSKGALVCMKCGNKTPFCNLCNKIINQYEDIVIIKPCGHVFHRVELLDWAEENKNCPKCKGKIKELSFDLNDIKS
ncbi:MAG: RING finger domain-containing protein [Candidatus Heimdallarchaeaceae archaeon]